MKKQSPVSRTIELDAAERVAAAVRTSTARTPGIVRGWKMASDPTYLGMVRAVDAERIEAGTATLIANLKR